MPMSARAIRVDDEPKNIDIGNVLDARHWGALLTYISDYYGPYSKQMFIQYWNVITIVPHMGGAVFHGSKTRPPKRHRTI